MSHPSVEDIKIKSRGLRGTLLEGLADPVTGSLSFEDQRLVKFHGTYQQDDRDIRDERRRQKLEPAHQFMIRVRAPGGVFTPEQWLKLDAIATTWANHSLRITTRQTFQFHGVIKRELKATMQAINAAALDTISACGDVNRNVLAASNPLQSRLHAEVHEWAQRLSLEFLPRTRAYYEIWLDQEKLADSGEEEDPVYGKVYLPRKFKMAVAVPPTNDVDLFANDFGLIAVVDADGGLAGFNVAIGGGMGASHGDPKTYPRLGNVIGFVAPDQVLAIAAAAVTVQRDHGDRVERKHARFKYTIDEHGLDYIVAQMEERAGFRLQPARPFHFDHNGDRFGWVEGEDGRWHLTLSLPTGRIADRPGAPHLTGMREIANVLRGGAPGQEFRVTANQNLIIAGVPAGERERIDALVRAHALDQENRAPTALARASMACVALPTCALAMAEAERYLPDLNAKLQPMLEKHGLADAPILLRISGCPNGCSRPYLGEIALVGKAPGRYNLMLGADHRGQRLNTLYRENITEAQILEELEPLFARYAAERGQGEGFGDFLHRAGVVALPPYPTHTQVLVEPAGKNAALGEAA
ncbi:assimilatory sulfite reductase (NADPH) hemoprotein subunit [Pseudoxanthomonas sp.]|uniref:assimilatory sulfite reductase (NADPH) hemoprotein subunit n=1 Tax=Pseudoxanthomonas sp. TaxID=1871049 RepID=UPI00258BD28C|nr:assimilatory sulfite reductase (NADPH) hemoprotein subunit [Pseudoxanthomonas sp.]MCR6685581.1 assimilatory sulfite reductase (NADPH) hemoprotein subunit [Pseudoxanthomonas sp.]